MIQMKFKFANETIRINVNEREIYYGDRYFQRLLRLIPPEEGIIQKIRNSRNRIPNQIAELFTLTEKEKQEYDSCKTDKEIADICIIDVTKKGGKLISMENGA